ncbi:glucose-6-phosphate exchanger SLC37A2-like [Lingula anatina]|uniref:Glucose-6-phosphate exchanger SLC37A2-like n=1 Tax=Lingula anatina TaxID=7574 RepID=A0A1S3IVJ8_LINAN|nr:glucose-6-phosphate exchanger SLC37A2-like [Lingula anatina]|eukprot:XP_013401569.1 glucose-6-phosphate exchanger SLC37A2-like [Lingula anatina]
MIFLSTQEPVHRYVYSRIPNAEEEPLSSQSVNNVDNLPQEHAEHEPISLLGALKVPGVVEFSLCLFFAKLVSYTFLFWLPKYIKATTSLSSEQSGDLSTVFDFGGIFGGIIAGVISDITGGRATVCLVMLIIAAPVLFIYNAYGTVTWAFNIFLLFTCGFFVNGPYALITTAVSADLGTHKSLKGNAKALATVTAIIDGTGSMGAALGPLLTGLITQGERKDAWKDVFYMLIAADVAALLLLFRLVYREFSGWCRRREVEL